MERRGFRRFADLSRWGLSEVLNLELLDCLQKQERVLLVGYQKGDDQMEA
jgi:hypothetical protein